MNDVTLTLLAVLSVVAALFGVVYTIFYFRNNKKRIVAYKKTIDEKVPKTEYDRIFDIVYPFENEREKNHGEPVNELVYLNRANNIRCNSSLFKWINQ